MKYLIACATAAVLAGCNQGADAPANTTAAAGSASVAGAVTSPALADMSAMMVSMQSAAMPRDAALQRMHQRHEGMEQIGKANKAAGRAFKSGSPDLAAVRVSAATIARLAQQSSHWFPAGTGPDVGKTGAKPEIWQKPQDFAARTKAFQQAAAAFDAAAKAGEIGAAQARFGDLGKTCKACHDSYRSDMHKK